MKSSVMPDTGYAFSDEISEGMWFVPDAYIKHKNNKIRGLEDEIMRLKARLDVRESDLKEARNENNELLVILGALANSIGTIKVAHHLKGFIDAITVLRGTLPSDSYLQKVLNRIAECTEAVDCIADSVKKLEDSHGQ